MTGSTHRITLRRSTPLALAALAASAFAALTAGPASASASPSVINASLTSVSCPAAAACMGVGSWTDPTGESSFTLAEAWNGTSWSILRTPDPGSTNNELFGVSCTSPSSCMAVGDFIGIGNQMTLAERWDGTRWRMVKTPRP